jgi:hypothetical protein
MSTNKAVKLKKVKLKSFTNIVNWVARQDELVDIIVLEVVRLWYGCGKAQTGHRE